MEKKLHHIPITEMSNYRISTDGRIWSCYSKRFLRTRICNGYHYFTRTMKNKTKNYSIHRLLALVFIPNPNNYPVVNHKNENKLDNSLDNLEWVTQQQNLQKCSKTISHARRVVQLSGDEVINTYDSVTKAGDAIGLSRFAINKACLGVNKTAGGYTWKYEDDKLTHVQVDLSDAVQIIEYPNYYVFNDGRIYSKSRKSYLKPNQNASGYCYVTLCYQKCKKNHYIHRLVAEYYVDRPKGTTQVNHINKQRNDNKAQNLEWVTCTENMKHMHANKVLVPS